MLEKSKNVVYEARSIRIGKNCALCLEYCPRPTASSGSRDLGHGFSQYGTPGWRIKYTYPALPTLDLVYSLQVV